MKKFLVTVTSLALLGCGGFKSSKKDYRVSDPADNCEVTEDTAERLVLDCSVSGMSAYDKPAADTVEVYKTVHVDRPVVVEKEVVREVETPVIVEKTVPVIVEKEVIVEVEVPGESPKPVLRHFTNICNNIDVLKLHPSGGAYAVYGSSLRKIGTSWTLIWQSGSRYCKARIKSGNVQQKYKP